MLEFLIKSCGLSLRRAISASKVVPKATSIEQADSVRHFFKHHGFDKTSICRVISNCPNILARSIEKTLQPNLQALSNLGFAEAELQVLIASNPYVVANSLAIPRLVFWEMFLGTDRKKDLVKIFARNKGLLGHDIVSGISPKMALLREHGSSDADIARLVRKGRDVMLRSCKTIAEKMEFFKEFGWLEQEFLDAEKMEFFKAQLKRTKEIGFDIKQSLMVLRGLSSLSGFGKSTFARKMEFFKGFGWSEQDFLDAFKRAPFVVHLKEENIAEKMEFLVGRVGCKQSYIASRPLLLAFSLEKRLKPRHHVLEILKGSKLVERELNFYVIVCLVDKKFVEKFIVPYKHQVPKIQEIYVAACAGQYNSE